MRFEYLKTLPLRGLGGAFFLLFFLFALSVYSQEKSATPFNGMIVDLQGKPLKGVRVWTQDAKRYAISDKKGRFGLTNVIATDTIHLKVKRMQYNIAVDGRKSMRITLADQIESILEDKDLIDAGYGYVRHREVVHARGGITGEQLRATGCSSLMEALKGRIPGLDISTDRFGEATNVTIRGIKSIYGSNEPLYIVDGTTVDNLDFINIYDVDYVEVMKDAPIYGSRGANGAIIVHTINSH